MLHCLLNAFTVPLNVAYAIAIYFDGTAPSRKNVLLLFDTDKQHLSIRTTRSCLRLLLIRWQGSGHYSNSVRSTDKTFNPLMPVVNKMVTHT